MNRQKAIALFAVAGALGVAAWLTMKGAGVRRFAEAIAFAEGYGTPGAIPTVRNNPGDLILGQDTTPSTFSTASDGWAALDRQLNLIVSGLSGYYGLNQTIGEMSQIWTATDQAAWAGNVVAYLQTHGQPTVTTATTLREVLT